MEAAQVHQLHVVRPEQVEGFNGEPTPENLRLLLSRVTELERQLEEQRAELMKARTRRAADDLEDELAGAYVTIKKQNREIGTLRRKVEEEADPLSHPKGREIVQLIERWMVATGHPNSKVSDDRVKLVKARLKDGYTIEQLELAIDGLGAYRYVVNAQRKSEGKESQRHDRLGIALGGGEDVEKFAVMGHRARKAGLVTWGEES